MNELYGLHRFILQTPQYGAANAHSVQETRHAPADNSWNEAIIIEGYRYFFWYITSFTSFTVRGTSGSAAATRLGA
jgi:hypothetical protein